MQRTGRRGLAQYRMVVQDSRQTPTSGKNVASLGHYDPHTKENGVDIEKAKFYLEHGAQPSNRVAKFLSDNGVKLPDWVNLDNSKAANIKNAEKLRKNRPVEEVAEEPAAEASEAVDTPAETEETPAAEEPVVDTTAEAEKPAEA